MTINKTTRKILKAFSFNKIDVEVARNIADIKRLDPLKKFYRKMDVEIGRDGYEIPVRIFFPDEETYQEKLDVSGCRLMLFFHGGGWATDHVENYERICARLSADTKHVVAAVEYRLAPEYKFPIGLEDCYAAAKAVCTGKLFPNIDAADVTLIGDSAGGNLAAALSLMARDRKEFRICRQILIYPAVNNDYSDHTPFASVKENGTDYILTQGKLIDYLNYYAGSEADFENPYFAPILAENLEDQPDTLILTAEFDPLRDEGEAYGKRLRSAGNRAVIHRIKDAVHGFFALGFKHLYVQESFDSINRFLGGSKE